MAKLIPMEEAAAMLGLSAEQLSELRSNNEISGTYTGSTWKFKESEIERYAAEIGIELAGADNDDFELSNESDSMTPDDDIIGGSSESSDIFGDSSSRPGEGDLEQPGIDSGDVLDDDEPKSGSPSDTGKLLAAGDDEDLFSDDLELADSASFEDSDLVLEDSDSSTEIVLESNDSGLTLGTGESGIELEEEPLELGGSDIDSLELPEDDDMIVLDDVAASDAATVMQEDDFNLTPLEESLDDESSGSQVIALEDTDIYADESEATILADSEEMVAQPGMLDDPSGVGLAGAAAGGAAMGPGFGQAPMVVGGGAPSLPEAPYSLWQVLSLALVLLLLVTGGVIIFDVARNMWMPSDRVISKSLLNVFLELVGMNMN